LTGGSLRRNHERKPASGLLGDIHPLFKRMETAGAATGMARENETLCTDHYCMCLSHDSAINADRWELEVVA
jgi:hypothetical protein